VTLAPTPSIGAATSSSSSKGLLDETTTYVWISIAGAVVLALLVFLFVRHRRLKAAEYKRRRLIHYLRTLCGLNHTSHRYPHDKAVTHARYHVLDTVKFYSPHVVEYHTKQVGNKVKIVKRLHVHGHHSVSPGLSGEAYQTECDGAMFIALDLDRQDFIPLLVKEVRWVLSAHGFYDAH
jgi:hypothetical protein